MSEIGCTLNAVVIGFVLFLHGFLHDKWANDFNNDVLIKSSVCCAFADDAEPSGEKGKEENKPSIGVLLQDPFPPPTRSDFHHENYN